MRAVIFLLFVVLVFFVVRFTLNRIIAIRDKQNAQQAKYEQNQNKQANASEQNNSENTQEMVRCAKCGVHLPQSEAYYDGKDTFCSQGHMQDFHQK